MITVFGSINIDLVASVDLIAAPGETVMATGYRTFFGGKGANQAVAAARAAGAETEVGMVAAIGDDQYGAQVAQNLEAHGVSCMLRCVDGATGMAFISVDARGENAITVVGGANAGLKSAHLTDAQLARTTLVVLQLEAPLAESLAVAERAHQLSIPVLWNIAPLAADLDAAKLSRLLGYTTFLVANAHEATSLAALTLTGHENIEAVVSALAQRYGLTCIVTLGEAGALAATPTGVPINAPAPQVTVLDTTGAGDTFCGVLAVGLSEGLPLDQTLRRAVAAGSLSCTGEGAQTAMPSRSKIDAAVLALPR